ncbi:hypothetical protein CCZ01_08455 [Helicobacter monodelphidis]|nr:hypothetical protein CCZ01_08455 [Helicobacter sp. 15-1451]
MQKMRILAILLICFQGGLMANEIIVFEFEGQSVELRLAHSEGAKEFLAQLPLRLEFSDFARKEKIARAGLPKALRAKGDRAYQPQIGDLFYYKPWGNIGIFYEIQPASSDLILLGKLTNPNDIEKFKALKKDFWVKIDINNDK